MSAFALCAAAAFVTTFGVALISKLTPPAAFGDFSSSLLQFGVQRRWQPLAAGLIVGAEASAIALVLLPVPLIARLAPAMVLLLGFSVAVTRTRGKRGSVACHCFGLSTQTNVTVHIATNSALLLLGVTALTAPQSHAGTAGARIFAIGIGTIVGVAVVAAEPVLEALRPNLVGEAR